MEYLRVGKPGMISVVSLIIKEDFNERYTRNLPYRQTFNHLLGSLIFYMIG